jgi:hypothetical protein
MCFSSRTRLFLAKLETTEGVDANPVVGTDDLFVLQASSGVAGGVSTVQVDPASPTGDELPQAISTRKPVVGLEVPMYGKGISGGDVVPGAWVRVLLQSVGHVNYNAGAGGGVQIDWTPDPIYASTTDAAGVVTAANKTFTLYELAGRDGSIASGIKVLRKALGCKVTSVNIGLTVGQWAVASFGISGLWVEPESSTLDLTNADLDNVASDFVRINGASQTFSFPGPTSVPLRAQAVQWAIDFGGEHIEGDNTDSGVACIGLGATRITGTANPILVSSQINLWEDAKSAQTTLAYSMTAMTPAGRTAGTGYSIKIAAPAVQVVGDVDLSSTVVRQGVTLRAVSTNGTTVRPMTISLT